MSKSHLAQFNPDEIKIDDWLEIFILHCTLHDIDATKTKPLLLTHLQPLVYSTLKSLNQPTALTDASITADTLTKQLQKQYEVKPNKQVARHRYSSAHQAPGETIKAFALRLRNLAIDCAFGAQLDERLREQFAIGVSERSIKERCFTETNLDTYDREALL